jgi:hypothetical protein
MDCRYRPEMTKTKTVIIEQFLFMIGSSDQCSRQESCRLDCMPCAFGRPAAHVALRRPN